MAFCTKEICVVSHVLFFAGFLFMECGVVVLNL